MPVRPDLSNGLFFAVGAYFIWGLLPLYIQLVRAVPPVEFVAWRIVFTVPVCLGIVALRRQWPDVVGALRRPAVSLALLASALLIGTNWLVYVYAVQTGHVLATSLGYYINPLVNVLLGTLFLKERLAARQWLAVGIAAAGVALLAWGAREMLAISLALAGSFALYGLVRKLAPVGSLPGLTVESGLLSLPAGAFLMIAGLGGTAAYSFGADPGLSLLVALSGVLTATPLLMFALAARLMDYSALGFVQFLAPTIQFAIGFFVFGEPLRPIQLACFVLIWTAVAVFAWDILARRRAALRQDELVPAAEEIRRVDREPV
jgi:chloramphenicol-sensitive protein RarD